jgi:hypothetical protein
MKKGNKSFIPPPPKKNTRNNSKKMEELCFESRRTPDFGISILWYDGWKPERWCRNKRPLLGNDLLTHGCCGVNARLHYNECARKPESRNDPLLDNGSVGAFLTQRIGASRCSQQQSSRCLIRPHSTKPHERCVVRSWGNAMKLSVCLAKHNVTKTVWSWRYGSTT